MYELKPYFAIIFSGYPILFCFVYSRSLSIHDYLYFACNQIQNVFAYKATWVSNRAKFCNFTTKSSIRKKEENFLAFYGKQFRHRRVTTAAVEYQAFLLILGYKWYRPTNKQTICNIRKKNTIKKATDSFSSPLDLSISVSCTKSQMTTTIRPDEQKSTKLITSTKPSSIDSKFNL